jgi:hypothetical protein
MPYSYVRQMETCTKSDMYKIRHRELELTGRLCLLGVTTPARSGPPPLTVNNEKNTIHQNQTCIKLSLSSKHVDRHKNANETILACIASCSYCIKIVAQRHKNSRNNWVRRPVQL